MSFHLAFLCPDTGRAAALTAPTDEAPDRREVVRVLGAGCEACGGAHDLETKDLFVVNREDESCRQ